MFTPGDAAKIIDHQTRRLYAHSYKFGKARKSTLKKIINYNLLNLPPGRDVCLNGYWFRIIENTEYAMGKKVVWNLLRPYRLNEKAGNITSYGFGWINEQNELFYVNDGNAVADNRTAALLLYDEAKKQITDTFGENVTVVAFKKYL